MKTLLTPIILWTIFGIALVITPASGKEDEKELFLNQNPWVEEFVVFFAKTSIEREILILEAENQITFTFLMKLIENENLPDGGLKKREKLKEELNLSFQIQKDSFESMKGEIPADSELYYINVIAPEKSKGCIGYLALKNGKIVFDQTFSLAGEKLDLESFGRKSKEQTHGQN